jgi:hypothetical protein
VRAAATCATTKATLCSGGERWLNIWAQYSATICIFASANADAFALRSSRWIIENLATDSIE